MADAPTHIPGLLHDASLIGVQWRPDEATMTLVLRCLRRGPGDEDLSDVPVEIRMTGVSAVALGHSPALPGTRPSEYRPSKRARPADLQSWDFGPQELETFVNSAQADEDLLAAYSAEWASGTERDLASSAVRFAVFVDHSAMLGLPATNFVMLVSGEGLTATSDGRELERATWERQFAAWWDGWEKHWDEKAAGDDEADVALEDTFIPVGEDEPLDPNYVPPDEPVVIFDAQDVPAAVLQPIRAWFESAHDRDALARARAWADLDMEPEEQAKRVETDFERDYGRWPYARQIDEWWTEGRVGEVVVRGVEHCMPMDEDPAENTESVWTFRMRQRGDAWVIRTWSQGWPPHGSAPTKAASEKPWLRHWSSGAIQ